jgi:DNA-directed RNA polymerase specialized sigma24 family protein
MQDRELVAAIVAGDPDGLAEAYDCYAAPLYAYCRLMLPDPDPRGGAALAVQDTFIIAAAKLRALRDPDQLRSWLHAVARNECLRRSGSAGSQGNGSDTVRFAGQPDPDGATSAVTLPPGLREQVLKACADDTPTGRAYRVSVTHHVGTFGRRGFPKPIVPPGPAWWQEVRRRRRAAAAVAAVAGAVLVVGIVTLLIAGGSHPATATTVALGGGVSLVPSAQAPGSAPEASSPGHKAVAVKATTTSSVLADTPTTSQGTTPGHSRPSTPAPSSSGSPSPSPSPSPSSSPAQGQLTAAPTKLVLSAVKGQAARGTFTLTAVGGPVSSYAIVMLSSMAGKVSVSPATGTLAHAGDKVVVTVTVKSLVALATRLTVEPGGQFITVTFSIKA